MEHMENRDYKDEQAIDSLVDVYKSNPTSELQLKLIKEFHGYFTKYSNLLCSSVPVAINNPDTLKFLRLFMTPEERETDESLFMAARKLIPFLRASFRDFTREDLYNEMIVFFLEQLERYHPMIADHKHSRERISFVHYLQVNLRFKLKALVKLKQRDVLSCAHNMEFDDSLDFLQSNQHEPGTNLNDIDLEWVKGTTASEPFRCLSELDRYILFLKFHINLDKPRSDYKLADLTGMDRVYIRRRWLKIKDKLKELTSIN